MQPLWVKLRVLIPACPYPLSLFEGPVLLRHLYLCTVQQFLNGEYLDARVVLAPHWRVIVASADRFGPHVAAWLFEDDEHSHSGVLARYSFSEVAYVAALDLAGLDLHQYPLWSAAPLVYEVDNAIYALVAALLSGLAFTFRTKRLCTLQRQHPPLELVAVVLCQLTGSTYVQFSGRL